jgi:hypothetical protein
MTTRYLFLAAAAFVFAAPLVARADVLTFDTFPNSAPATDNGLVDRTMPYTVGGISFTVGFDTDGNNIADRDAALEIAAGGTPEAIPDGFFNDGLGVVDTAAPGFEARLGAFFLRHPDGLIGVPFPTFVIQYDSATRPTAAAGEIWDIDASPDGTEQWRVTAYDMGGSPLDSSLSPLGIFPGPGSLDALPWLWSFSLNDPIDRIEFEFLGTKTTGIGLAFDNFAPAGLEVPEPGSLVLWGLMLVAALCGCCRCARKP